MAEWMVSVSILVDTDDVFPVMSELMRLVRTGDQSVLTPRSTWSVSASPVDETADDSYQMDGQMPIGGPGD